MEQQVKTKVQFADNYNAFTNLENNDSLSTGFGKIHYDLGYLNSEDQRQESEINAIAQAGSKNICPIGTETHNSEIGFGTEYSFPMPEGAYIISFTGTMVAPIQFNVYSESGTRIALVDIHTIQEAEAGIRFVLNDNATKCKFWYDTSDNYTLSNIMIRDANITDNTFQPYSPTNRELYDALGGKQGTISDLDTIRSGAALGVTSVQDIQINGTTQTKTNGVVNLPAYPTTLPASDTTSTYSSSGTAPVNGTAVAAALGTLDVSSVGGSGKYISAISESNGKISATETTMDTTPTANSTVPVTSGGVQAPLAEVVNAGAKNLLNNSQAVSQTVGNVIFTLNADGSITANGTKNNNDWFILSTGNSLKAGTYVLSDGIPIDKTGCQLIITTDRSLGTAIMATAANDRPKTTVLTTDYTGLYYAIRIASGTVVNNLTFYPMLCTKAEWDVSHDYVPYGKTNADLTAEINYAINTGAKNLLNPTDYIANSRSGVIITYNGDGTYSLSGTPTQTSDYLYTPDDIYTNLYGLQVGQAYTISTGVESSKVLIRIVPSYNGTSYDWNNPIVNNVSTEATFTIPSNVVGLLIDFRSSTSAGSLNRIVLKPMIRPAAITDSTFQPYALPNPTLTPAAIKAVDEGAKNLLNLNTDFTTATSRGITYKNNKDGTIKVSGTSSAGDSYINLYDRNTDNLFGIQKGKTVVLRSTSDDVSINLIYKKSDGNYSSTVYGYKSSPVWFTVPSDFVGFLLRIGVPRNGTTVNEDVGGMICTATDYAVSKKFVPYALPNPTLTPAVIKAVDEGAKNLLNITETSGSLGTATITINSDNSITINGQPSANGAYVVSYQSLVFTEPVVLSTGSAMQGKKMSFSLRKAGTSQYVDAYQVSTKEIPAGSYDRVHIYLYADTSYDLTIYPMICTKSDWAISQKFVPYALSNPTLTPAAIKAVDEGAKNIANWSASTSTISGVTFTINSDKTVSTSGAATARSQKSLAFTVPSTLKSGRYVLSGCPNGGEQSGTILYCLYIWDVTANARVASGNDTGNGLEFDWIPDASHTYNITVDVRSGSSASGLIFKPMICTASDWAVSKKFVPYCPTIYELYQMILALQSGTRSLSLSAPSENISKGAIDTTAEEEPETLKSEVDDDVHTETDDTEQR